MKRDWKFEPSDFNDMGLQLFGRDIVAERANAKLEQWLADATVVYGQGIEPMKSAMWCMNGPDFERYKHTHRALLIDIQELPKEPCKHEPAIKLIKENGIEVSLEGPCRRCGVPLKAKWEEA